MAVRYEYRMHDAVSSASLVVEGSAAEVLADVQALGEAPFFDAFFEDDDDEYEVIEESEEA